MFGPFTALLKAAIHPPGAGWQPTPHTRVGSWRRRRGEGWEYWSPAEAAHRQLDLLSWESPKREEPKPEAAPIQARKAAETTPKKADPLKLRWAGDSALAEAEGSIERPRKYDTHKRLRESSGAVSTAMADKRRALKAIAIADSNARGGEASGLEHFGTMADVETFDAVLRRASYDAMRREAEATGGSPDWHSPRAPKPEDVIGQAVPLLAPVLHESWLRDLAEAEALLPNPDEETHEAFRAIRLQVDGDRGMEVAGKDPERRRRDLSLIQATTKATAEVDKALRASPEPAHGDWQARNARSSAKSAVSNLKDELRSFGRTMKILGLPSETIGERGGWDLVQQALERTARSWIALDTPEVKESPAQAVERKKKEVALTRPAGYFPTPPDVAGRVVDLAGVEPGMTVLEPSAGTGALAIVARAAGGNVKVIERHDGMREILRDQGFEVVGSDALAGPDTGEKFDRIVMNPPFEDGQDIEHVKRAFESLKPGGRLVAIMSEGPFFRETNSDRDFRAWLGFNAGRSEKVASGAFQASDVKTGTATRIVTIGKPAIGVRLPEVRPPHETVAVSKHDAPGAHWWRTSWNDHVGDEHFHFHDRKKDAEAQAEDLRHALVRTDISPSHVATARQMKRVANDLDEAASMAGQRGHSPVTLAEAADSLRHHSRALATGLSDYILYDDDRTKAYTDRPNDYRAQVPLTRGQLDEVSDDGHFEMDRAGALLDRASSGRRPEGHHETTPDEAKGLPLRFLHDLWMNGYKVAPGTVDTAEEKEAIAGHGYMGDQMRRLGFKPVPHGEFMVHPSVARNVKRWGLDKGGAFSALLRLVRA